MKTNLTLTLLEQMLDVETKKQSIEDAIKYDSRFRPILWSIAFREIIKNYHPGDYYGNNIKEYQVCISIPSGRIVIGNDFREIFKIDKEIRGEGKRGLVETTKNAAIKNMLFVYVGNSCPSVYKNNLDEIRILCPGYRREAGPPYGDLPADEPEGKCVGWVCTDLCWFCAVDYNQFIKAGGDFSEKDTILVSLPPGRYTATCFFEDSSEEYLKDDVYVQPERTFCVIKREGSKGC